MTKNDELTKIIELLEIVKHKVDLSESHRTVHSATIHLIKDQLSVINKKIDDITEKLDSHSDSLVNIESKLDSYADSYKINRHNIERVDTRLGAVEDSLGIKPPEDLKVPHFAE